MTTSSTLLATLKTSPRPSRAAASALFALVFVLTPLACSRLARAQEAPSPQSAAPTPTPTVDASNASGARRATKGTPGTITGRVLGDGGEPLAGARVFVFTAASNRSNVDAPTATDEGGSFKLENLAPGLYTVGATYRGYVPDPETYPAGRPAPLNRPGDDVTVRLVRGGVVTGAVTNADGEPLVAINVRAVYVRDLDGDTTAAGASFGEDQTDDRGVYRIYGLRQGVYVFSTGADNARANWPGAPAPYRNDSPTYYPSGTRDTASEVTVRSGQEVGGIDIRHRGDRGRRITGLIVSPTQPQQQQQPQRGGPPAAGFFVVLTHAATGTQLGSAFVQQNASGERAFGFDGVGEGEYEVQARSFEAGTFTSSSPSQRVVVAAADVTGLRLTLTPLASISGSFVVEPAAETERAQGECKERRADAPLLPQEAAILAQRVDTPQRVQPARQPTARRETSPDSSGTFTLRGLEAGRYRLDLRLGDEHWYVRELQFPTTANATNTTATTTTTTAAAATASTKPGPALRPSATPAGANAAANTPAPRDTVELKLGQQFGGLVVRVAEGAATLSGRVTPREESATLPPASQLRVHLVPAAREQAEDSLRYAETTPNADGSYAFRNLAPGRYLLLVRGVENEPGTARPAAWDTATRARLRREAEAANVSVELQPCRRATDFALRFPHTQGK